jgi:hypothetical protein
MTSVVRKSEIKVSVDVLEKNSDVVILRVGADPEGVNFDYAAFGAECNEVRRFLLNAPWLSEVRYDEEDVLRWIRLYSDLWIDRRVLAIAKVVSKRLIGWEQGKTVVLAYLDIRENSIDPVVGIARALCGDGGQFE